MPRTRPAKVVVREAAQIKALTGPLPQKIVAAFERLEAATAAEVATAIDEPAESLYYHLRRLVRTGLLRQCGTRATGRRPEAVYELPGRELSIDQEGASPAFLEALRRSLSALLRLAERSCHAALDWSGARRKGARRNLMVQQHYVRLRAADLAELNRRLEDIADFVRERDAGSAAPWLTLTMVLSPLPRERSDGD